MTALASLQPIALSPSNPQAFLQFILEHSLKATTLIICSTREAFLDDLQEPNQAATGPHEHDSADQVANQQTDALIYPSLRQIAVSRCVKLVFVSTIPQLRAYLSTYQASSYESPDNHTHDAPTQRQRLLAIWGLLNLHRSGFEYSAQGLCRTLGSAVDAAHFSKQRLILGEKPVTTIPARADVAEVADVESGSRNPWEESIPLLNSSAMHGDERMLLRRSIQIRTILQRWCHFQEDPNILLAD